MFTDELDAMERLHLLVDEIVEIDASVLCDDTLRNEIALIRREIDRLEYQASKLAATAHHRNLAAMDGAVSTPSWLQFHTGQHYREAQGSVRAGIACQTLELTARKWRDGHMSASAARMICRGMVESHVDEYLAIEDKLCSFASGRAYWAAQAAIRHYRRCAAQDNEKEPQDTNGVHLSAINDDWVLNGSLDALCGQTLSEALEAATDPACDGDTRSPAQRRAAALTRIARFFLDHNNNPGEATNAPHISIGINWHDLIRDFNPEHFIHGLQPNALTGTQIRQLLCDANVSRIVYGPDGTPIDLGRSRRVPNQPLRRAIIYRDKHCRYPGCDRPPKWGEIHHLIPWEHDGPTNYTNLILLCTHHHHIVHKPGWITKFDGNQLTVITPDGRTLTPTE